MGKHEDCLRGKNGGQYRKNCPQMDEGENREYFSQFLNFCYSNSTKSDCVSD